MKNYNIFDKWIEQTYIYSFKEKISHLKLIDARILFHKELAQNLSYEVLVNSEKVDHNKISELLVIIYELLYINWFGDLEKIKGNKAKKMEDKYYFLLKELDDMINNARYNEASIILEAMNLKILDKVTNINNQPVAYLLLAKIKLGLELTEEQISVLKEMILYGVVPYQSLPQNIIEELNIERVCPSKTKILDTLGSNVKVRR